MPCAVIYSRSDKSVTAIPAALISATAVSAPPPGSIPPADMLAGLVAGAPANQDGRPPVGVVGIVMPVPLPSIVIKLIRVLGPGLVKLEAYVGPKLVVEPPVAYVEVNDELALPCFPADSAIPARPSIIALLLLNLSFFI